MKNFCVVDVEGEGTEVVFCAAEDVQPSTSAEERPPRRSPLRRQWNPPSRMKRSRAWSTLGPAVQAPGERTPECRARRFRHPADVEGVAGDQLVAVDQEADAS